MGDKSASIVHVRSETDFVARNDLFQQLVADLSETALANQTNSGEMNAEAFLGNALASSEQSVSDAVTDVAARVRENIVLHRVASLSVSNGAVSSYVHGAVSPGLGTSGAIVALETDAESDPELLQTIGHRLAMHVVAAKPEYLNPDAVPSDVVEKEMSLLKEELKDSGKPENIIEKIVQGRIAKFYSERCLSDQPHFIEEGSPKVKKVLKQSAKELGTPVHLRGFYLFSI